MADPALKSLSTGSPRGGCGLINCALANEGCSDAQKQRALRSTNEEKICRIFGNKFSVVSFLTWNILIFKGTLTDIVSIEVI